jgi:hypothetical protein
MSGTASLAVDPAVADFIRAFGAGAAAADDPVAAVRGQAINDVAALRGVTATIAKVEPFAGMPDQANGLAKKVEQSADDLEGMIGALNLGMLPPDKRTQGYQAVSTKARAEAARYTKEIDNTRRVYAAAKQKSLAGQEPRDSKPQLEALAQQQAGRTLIDDMVATLGGAAKSAADKKFVAVALEARYDVTLTGDLSTKAIPKIYSLLGRLPDSHVRGNERLETIERIKSKVGGGAYSGAERKVKIAGRAGYWTDEKVTMMGGVGKVDQFDHVTLHEVGHSVNHMFPSNAFAGWAEVAGSDIRQIILGDFGLRNLAGYPPHWIETYVQVIFDSTYAAPKDPKADAGLDKIWKDAQGLTASGATRADLLADAGLPDIVAVNAIADGKTKQKKLQDLRQRAQLTRLQGARKQFGEMVCKELLGKGPAATPAGIVDALLARLTVPGNMPANPDWNALANHPGVVWFNAVKMPSASDGLWNRGQSGAQKYTRGEKVYQEGNEGHWYSYPIAARTHAVSDYQFRAPEEWFAELYAVFYQGKLPDTHPQFAWFRDTVNK